MDSGRYYLANQVILFTGVFGNTVSVQFMLEAKMMKENEGRIRRLVRNFRVYASSFLLFRFDLAGYVTILLN